MSTYIPTYSVIIDLKNYYKYILELNYCYRYSVVPTTGEWYVWVRI